MKIINTNKLLFQEKSAFLFQYEILQNGEYSYLITAAYPDRHPGNQTISVPKPTCVSLLKSSNRVNAVKKCTGKNLNSSKHQAVPQLSYFFV